MTKLFDQAIAKAQLLPPEMQDAIGRLVLTYMGDGEPGFDLTPDEEASFATSFAQAERGAFATDEQVRAIWAKHGL